MNPLLVPVGLLLLATLGKKQPQQQQQGPQPTPPPGATTRKPARPARRVVIRKGKAIAIPASQAKPLRGDPYAPPMPKIQFTEHPNVIPAAEAPLQAAVDAGVSQAIREGLPKPAAVSNEPVVPGGRTPERAAKDLLAYLIKTGRFGTLKDRPKEVRAAQTDLGVKSDGIVGPKTRAAARAHGVALPPAK